MELTAVADDELPYQCIELYQFSNGAPDNAIPYETTMKETA